MQKVELVVLRRCYFGGRLLQEGERIAVSALEAANGLDSGRCRLANESDLAAVNSARHAEALAIDRKARTAAPNNASGNSWAFPRRIA